MTSVPTKIIERRVELGRQVEAHHAAIRIHESELRAERDELRLIAAQISEIDFAISVYAECAVSPEADRGKTASGATPGAPEVEKAAAVVYGGQSLGAATDERLAGYGLALGGAEASLSRNAPPPNADESPSTKKTRAPKRDIRGMVLEAVGRWAAQSPRDLAANLSLPVTAVEKAVAYWQAKGRLTIKGGFVMLRTHDAPADVDHPDLKVTSVDVVGDQVATWMSVVPPPVSPGHALVHEEAAEVSEDGITYGIGGLIAFLQAEPDSTMAEINAAGIPAPEVYLAEKDGIVIAKAHGLYALVDTKAKAAE